jgi:hypothetical protein
MNTTETRTLPFDGLEISLVSVGWTVTFRMEEPSRWYELQIVGSFVLRNDADSWTVDPEGSPDLLAPVLNLVRRPVLRAVAFEDGRLDLALVGNYEIEIPSGDMYESWTLVGSDGSRIVSMPDAQLAIWEPASDADRADVHGGSGPGGSPRDDLEGPR